MKYFAKVDDQEFVIEVGHEDQIIVNDEPYEIDFQQMPGSGVTSLIIGNHSLEAVVEDGQYQQGDADLQADLRRGRRRLGRDRPR